MSEKKKYDFVKIEKYENSIKEIYVDICIPLRDEDLEKDIPLDEISYHAISIPFHKIDNLMAGLRQAKKEKLIPYVESEEDKKYMAFQEEREALRKKWWMRAYKLISDIGIQITPFNWGFSIERYFLATKVVLHSNEKMFQSVEGALKIGPMVITW